MEYPPAVWPLWVTYWRIFHLYQLSRFTGEPWSGEWESNPHGLGHRNLNPARLPIPPYPDVAPGGGIEPTFSAWKADVLAVVLHLRILGQTRGDLNPDPCEGRHLPFWRSVPWN